MNIDINLIEICAESAYMDIYLENYIEDNNYLIESSIIDSIKTIGKKCIEFLKSIIQKIKNRLSNFINNIKAIFSAGKSIKQFSKAIEEMSDAFVDELFDDEEFKRSVQNMIDEINEINDRTDEKLKQLNESSSNVLYIIDYNAVADSFISSTCIPANVLPDSIFEKYNSIINTAKANQSNNDVIVKQIDNMTDQVKEMNKITCKNAGFNFGNAKYNNAPITDLPKNIKYYLYNEVKDKKYRISINSKRDLLNYINKSINVNSCLNKLSKQFSDLDKKTKNLEAQIANLTSNLDKILKSDSQLDPIIASSSRIFISTCTQIMNIFLNSYAQIISSTNIILKMNAQEISIIGKQVIRRK